MRQGRKKTNKQCRVRQILFDATYMRNLKCDADELICETNRLTDPENRLVLAKVGDGRGMGWKFGISRCKLLYTCMAITLPYTRS